MILRIMLNRAAARRTMVKKIKMGTKSKVLSRKDSFLKI
jgi:hypothetical protein